MKNTVVTFQEAKEKGEIRSSCNTELLVQQVRLIFLGH